MDVRCSTFNLLTVTTMCSFIRGFRPWLRNFLTPETRTPNPIPFIVGQIRFANQHLYSDRISFKALTTVSICSLEITSGGRSRITVAPASRTMILRSMSFCT